MSTVDTEAQDGRVTKKVNVTTLTDPRFLTLTKHPANQIAFRVVRSDAPPISVTEEVETPDIARVRRVRPVRRSALLSIEYPNTVDKDTIEREAKLMGLTGYTMQPTEEGGFMLVRSDLTTMPTDAFPTDTFRISLGEQRTATIARSDLTTTTTEVPGQTGITLVAIDFNKEQFPDTAAVLSFLSRNDIDFLESGVEDREGSVFIRRAEAQADGVEVRTMLLAEGVTASVVRSDNMDICSSPEMCADVISAAYCQWGWGSIDFVSGLADVEFNNVGRQAVDMLNSVLDNILFYSSLPVSVRKELVVRAVNQFSVYMVSLLEALPEKLVIINRSTDMEKDMTDKKIDATAAEEVKRGEADTDVSAVTTEGLADEKPITRSEVKEIVEAAVTAALAACGKEVVRSDAVDTVGASTEAAPVTINADTVVAAVEQAIQRSVGGLEGTLSDLATRMTAIESATVVRSDTPDTASQPATKSNTFSGIFGSMGRG